MHRLVLFVYQLIAAIPPAAERLGAPGLAGVALLDSSFVPLPEVVDALVVLLTIQEPGAWLYLGMVATAGSVAGCYVLYALARKGGHAFLQRRLQQRHIDRGLAAFRRHGLLTLIVPAVLPPPMPFKPFVLLAGVIDIRPRTFLLAVVVGRGFRYGAEAWLAYMYGARASDFIRTQLPIVSVWMAALVLVAGVGAILWRRRRAV